MNGWRILGGVAVVFVGMIVAFIVAVKVQQSGVLEPEPAVASASAPAAVAEPEPPKPTAAQRLMAIRSLPQALGFLKPAMEDTTNERSTVALMLGVWMREHAIFQDVDPGRDETSFGKVMKDSEAERGKRMCATGTIVEIERIPGERGLFVGGLMSRGFNVVTFVSFGSTGELVANQRARLCGVVTGKFDYSNSAGGMTHSVHLAGAFDLPENRGAAE